ncbi:MAG TPA: glycosyltransferase [Terriglobales bacterium]|jgi:sugar transferase (PEP-CTERM/EpsH1 system associated)
MKILLTLRQPLYPADTGGKVRSLNIFSRLAKRASIHAVSFADPVADAASIQEMQRLFESYTPVFWQETKKYSPRFYKEIFTNQFSSLPYFLAKCRLPHFGSTVEGLLAKEHFDLLFSDFLHTAVPLLQCSFKPKVVFEHNVEFQLRKRKWQVEKHPLRKIVFGTEWKKTKPLEARVCRSFDHVLTVSEEDRETIRQEFGVDHISTLPTGVDTDFFCPSGNRPLPGRLAFVGSMDWDPNEDGVAWFLENIYPLIRRTVPNASFVVVGRNPSSRLRAIAAKTPAVQITGWVPDVRPYLSQAEVVVVPLRIGGGTRIKIPEAMAMGKAVVSTPIGAEGLHFHNNREICLADRPEDFARAAIAILTQPGLRDAIGTAARETVTSEHKWEAAVDRIEECLSQVVGREEARVSRDPELQTQRICA